MADNDVGLGAGVDGLPIRQAARALVLDEAHRVMLVRFDFHGAIVWATPGGGIQYGEDHDGALRRELLEELGLADVEVGAYLWERLYSGRMGERWGGQTDHVYAVHTEAFDPIPAMSWEELNAERVTALRWWTLDELETAASDGVRFAPMDLARHVRRYLEHGPPERPLFIET